jgi:hypothetical protein
MQFSGAIISVEIAGPNSLLEIFGKSLSLRIGTGMVFMISLSIAARVLTIRIQQMVSSRII